MIIFLNESDDVLIEIREHSSSKVKRTCSRYMRISFRVRIIIINYCTGNYRQIRLSKNVSIIYGVIKIIAESFIRLYFTRVSNSMINIVIFRGFVAAGKVESMITVTIRSAHLGKICNISLFTVLFASTLKSARHENDA